VLIPFFRQDPRALLAAMEPAAHRLGDSVEILMWDDGSCDPSVAGALSHAIAALACQAVLMSSSIPRGRTGAKQALVASARARHLLFLDAASLPVGANFLDVWLGFARVADPRGAFGGAVSCGVRRDGPAGAEEPFSRAVNVLLRRDALTLAPFSPEIHSWEGSGADPDWTRRVLQSFDVALVDNPVASLKPARAETRRKFALTPALRLAARRLGPRAGSAAALA
jgi:hypothetical protein